MALTVAERVQPNSKQPGNLTMTRQGCIPSTLPRLVFHVGLPWFCFPIRCKRIFSSRNR
jgi:hypothetical protein